VAEQNPINRPRVILLTAAQSYRTDAFLAAGAKLNVEIVRGCDVPPAHTGAGEAMLRLDFRDAERAVQIARAYAAQHRLSAVLATDDATVTLAAQLSEALDLAHNSIEAAEAARDKRRMRELFARARVPSPWFQPLTTRADPALAAAEARYPCVLKPARLSGSRGVIRANDAGEFSAAFARIKSLLDRLGQSEMLVEGYLPGAEVALEGILNHGTLKVLALFDKPDALDGPFFEETIYVTPSCLPPETQRRIAVAAQAAARALGLSEGPVHAELRVEAGQPWLVEVAGRSIGGLCGQTLRFAQRADVSLEELILRQALGREIESYQREERAGGVMMIPIPAAGIFMGARGLEAARAVPGIESIEITAREKYPLVPLPEGDSYLGFIFARGDTPAAVEAALRAAHRQLDFEIVPELPLA
jgi:biotin carboxylase